MSTTITLQRGRRPYAATDHRSDSRPILQYGSLQKLGDAWYVIATDSFQLAGVPATLADDSAEPDGPVLIHPDVLEQHRRDVESTTTEWGARIAGEAYIRLEDGDACATLDDGAHGRQEVHRAALNGQPPSAAKLAAPFAGVEYGTHRITIDLNVLRQITDAFGLEPRDNTEDGQWNRALVTLDLPVDADGQIQRLKPVRVEEAEKRHEGPAAFGILMPVRPTPEDDPIRWPALEAAGDQDVDA